MCNKKVSFNKIPWLSLTFPDQLHSLTFPDFPGWWEPCIIIIIIIIIMYMYTAYGKLINYNSLKH